MDTTCLKESQQSQSIQFGTDERLLKNFVEAVEIEFCKQNSSPTPMRWFQIQPLINKLKELKKITILQSQQDIFISYLLQYVEMILCFVSSYQDSEYRKQRYYASTLLGLIPDFFRESDPKNKFIAAATVKVLDLFTYGEFSLISKKELLKMYNTISIQSKKQVRIDTATNILYYMYKLIDCLSTYGDYVMQADIMETVFRIFGSQIRNNDIKYDLIPGSKELGRALVKDISIHCFDTDVRRWLNMFNSDSQWIFSIACKTVMCGSTICKTPDEAEGVSWIDFNLKDNIVSFYSIGDTDIEQWNRIIIIAKDVKKVEVKRFESNEKNTTISMHLLKPALSEMPEYQDYWNDLDQHLKIIIGIEEKEKITKLISHVLPRIFGDVFSHASVRISDMISKRVYKPLGIKISRKRSTTTSEISSATSKCKSNAASEPRPDPAKHSMMKVVTSTISKSQSDEVAVPEIKQSKLKLDTLRDDVSLLITDFTSFSRSDISSDRDASVFPSYNSEIFSNGPGSTDRLDDARSLQRQGQEKVQDNIVTSSHGANDDILSSPRIEIIAGKCSGSSPGPINDNIQFQPSEMLSSSPFKRSRQMLKDLNEEEVLPVDFINAIQKEDDHHHDVQIVEPKTSALIMSEDQFETALENLDGLDTLFNDSSDFEETKIKISRLMNQADLHVAERVKYIDESSIESSHHKSLKISKFNVKSDDIDASKSSTSTKTVQVCSKKTIKRIMNCERAKITNINRIEIISCDDSDSDDQPLSKLCQPKQMPESALEYSDEKRSETITQDLFEVPTQVNLAHIIKEEEIHSITNSEDIFSRQTQENILLNLKGEPAEQNFTELSLAVNVGVTETQNSEDVAITELANLKTGQTIAASKEGIEEYVIDLTNEENTAEFIIKQNEIRSVEDPKKVPLVVEISGHFTQEKPVLNTPELLSILKDGSPAGGSLTGIKETKEENNEKETDIENKKEVKINISQKQTLMNTKKGEEREVKKNKPRRLIKTGKKQFSLDEFDLDLVTKSDSVKILEEETNGVETDGKVLEEYNEVFSVEAEEASSKECKTQAHVDDIIENLSGKPDTVTSFAQIENEISTEDDYLKNTNKTTLPEEDDKPDEVSNKTDTSSIAESQVIKNTIKQPIIQLERLNIVEKDTESSQSEIEWAPELTRENVEYNDLFVTLKRMEEGHRLSVQSDMSGFIQKKRAKRIRSTQEDEDAQGEGEKQQEKEIIDNDMQVAKVMPSNSQPEVPFIPRSKKPKVKKVNKTAESKIRVPLKEIGQKVVDSQPGSGNKNRSNEQNDTQEPNINSTVAGSITKVQKADPINDKDLGNTIGVNDNGDDAENQMPGNDFLESRKDNFNAPLVQVEEVPEMNHPSFPSIHLMNELKENLDDSHAANTSWSDDYNEVARARFLRRKYDSSPELAPSKPIVTTAQVHRSEYNIIVPSGMQEKVVVARQSKRLLEKNTTSYKSSRQENENVDKSSGLSVDMIQAQSSPIKNKEPEARKSPDDFEAFFADAVNPKMRNKSPDLDLIEVLHSPILKGNKSKEPVSRKSPDPFDFLATAVNESNFTKVKNTTTKGNRTKKLFKPGSFSYLDEIEVNGDGEPTPDLDDTPIPVEERTKVPKQRKPRTKKQNKKGQFDEKPVKSKTPKKGTRATDASIKKRKPRKKKEFTLSTIDFKSLDELFDASCRGIVKRANSYVNAGALYSPIVARSRPQNSTSDDETPEMLRKLRKEANPETPELIRRSQTQPHSSDYSWPELEEIPITANTIAPRRKINILHNIVICPKRRSDEEAGGPIPKKEKLGLEEVENIPVPDLIENANLEKGIDNVPMPALDREKRQNDPPFSGRGRNMYKEAFDLMKFIITLTERHDPDSLRKLRILADSIDGLQ